MKFRRKLCMAIVMLSTLTASAGGILTNTNQSVNFLRNPARDAAIGLDGVYSNPAGVAFLGDGMHLGFNWQYAHQTRTITGTNELFAMGLKNNGNMTKKFEGVAEAPFVPSLQAAYNKNDWSFQLNISIPGGGGKCKFDDGIGTFETAVGAISNKLKGTSDMLNGLISPLGVSVPNVTGYDADGFMKGRQYYIGFQLGAARKINENLSVYGGLRLLYGTASYEARLSNIRVMNGNDGLTLPDYIVGVTKGLSDAKTVLTTMTNKAVQDHMINDGMTQEVAMQQPDVVALLTKGQQLQGAAEQVTASGEALSPYANGLNLKADQTGWGVAPVIGVDYKTGSFNFAAKYEFKTRMRLKNNSTLETALIDATEKFVDGTKVPEDSPALLTLGAQWSVTDQVRLNLGYHHFFDTDAHWYNHSEDLLDHGSNEYLAGAEWDATKKLQVSGGIQITHYGLTDEYMNDMSFVVDSWTFGLGIGYQVSDKVKINAAYFQTNYEDYDMNTPEQHMEGFDLIIPAGKNSFTRTNRVIGLGVELTL